MFHSSLSTFSSLCLASFAIAAPQGQPSPGLRMFAPLMSTDTYLVDNANQVVHMWSDTNMPGATAYVEADGTLLRTYNIPTGPAVPGRGGGLKRLAFDGTVTWDYQYADDQGWAHIDIEPMPNGNVLMLVWDRMPAADAIAAGRDPSLLLSSEWLPDAVVEVTQTGPTTGDVVWEWHAMDHVIQDFDPTKANYGVVADHPELLDINYPATVSTDGEWNHLNAIDYDPTTDLIVINSPFQNEFWIIDHSTTTAEAAGHTGGNYGRGGDILYRWGNPEAYGRGGPDDQKLFFQHSTRFIPPGRPGAGNILIYNNRAGTPEGLNYSTVVEIDLPGTFFLAPGQAYGPADYTWEYKEANPTDLFSAIMSSAERLPNGNTLISAAQMGAYSFEVDPFGNKVWEYTQGALTFQCDYLDETTLFADAKEISVTAGGTVGFDFVGGSASAGDVHLLIGSMTGTTPGFFVRGAYVPLNYDGYMLTTIVAANGGVFQGTAGMLDPLGRTSATYALPGGILPASAAGMEFHHAMVTFDSVTNRVSTASNAQPLVWTP